MPEKAGDVINDILLDVVVLGADADMDPSETASTMRYINRYMNMLAAKGINLGFTTISSVTDTITISDGAILGLIKNVAMLIAPQYGAIITPDYRLEAKDALDAMRNIGTAITPSQMPCTVPVGSGNDGGWADSKYYACPADEILTETDRTILLEVDT